MGYTTDRWGRLCCDNCGASGDARRVPCPQGYCPPAILCRACRTDPAVRDRLNRYHVENECARKSLEHRTREQRRREALEQGACLRVSALQHGAGSNLVRVIFEGGRDAHGYRRTFGADMTHATYDALPLGEIVGLEDYRIAAREMGEPEPVTAPADFNDLR